MAREMRPSGISWLGEIPAKWNVVNIRNLFSFGKGLPITKEDLRESGISVISYGQIHSKQNNGVSVKSELIRYVDQKYLSSNLESLVKKHDFIFADTSEDLSGCGNCVYIDTDIPIFSGYHTIILRSKADHDLKYFAFLFQSDAWRKQIRERVTGVKLFSISQKILRSTSVLVPPADEQQKISAFLDTECSRIDAVIGKTRASIEEYKKLKQSVITEAVTKGIRPGRKMKDSGLEWIGKIPEEWTILKIKWLLDERNERSEEGHEEPLSMSQKYGLIPTKEMDMVPNMASSFVGAKICYPGDLVFNKLKAHLGVFALSRFYGIVSPDYAVYRSSGIANLKYLEFLFKTPQYIAEFRKKSTGVGAGLTRLYTAGLFSIYSTIPPLSEQTEIVDYLDGKTEEIDALIRQKESIISEMESYKKSLIFEYVTGKKEVM